MTAFPDLPWHSILISHFFHWHITLLRRQFILHWHFYTFASSNLNLHCKWFEDKDSNSIKFLQQVIFWNVLSSSWCPIHEEYLSRYLNLHIFTLNIILQHKFILQLTMCWFSFGSYTSSFQIVWVYQGSSQRSTLHAARMYFLPRSFWKWNSISLTTLIVLE